MPALVLGTAQWGSDYGITNETGRISDAELGRIMIRAREVGVCSVDTAAGYGDAEARLRDWAAGLEITTKVSGARPELLRERMYASLARLGVSQVHACLIHDWHVLTDPQRLQVAVEMGRLSDAGLIARVGVSGYEMADVNTALVAFDRLDILQVPANAIDRRLDDSQALAGLSAAGCEIQVRSAFLQGLLVARPQTPLGAHPDLARFHEWCAKNEQKPIDVALGHVRALPWATHIVLGVTSEHEFNEVLASWGKAPERARTELASADLSLVDPRTWK